MINEIYVNNKLILNSLPNKQFKEGYKIRCILCKELIERKYYNNKILNIPYECKKCILKTRNPMHNTDIKEKHNSIVKSKEYKDKMRMSTLNEKNGFYGKKHTNETIQKIINANKEYRNSLTDDDKLYISKICSKIQKKLMDDNPKEYKRLRSKAARISHKKQFENVTMNGIEKKVYEYVKTIEPSVKYSVILASYQFDFGIKYKKILIEVDGDYWHGNPKYYNIDGSDSKRQLNEIQLKKIESDEEKKKWAESRGFKLLRLWEEEINNDTFKNKIKNYLI